MFLHPVRLKFPRLTARRVALCAAVFLTVLPARAQSSIGDMRRQATRAELEQAAKATDAAATTAPGDKARAKLRADAAALRQRLTNGDFVPGDRILLLVLGDSALTDTFTVRSDRRLQLPNIPDISLHGVLDSELEPFLEKELARYIKQVDLTATPLVRVAVLGAVAQPRYYTVPADLMITDLINGAGGVLALTGDISKAVVRRAGDVFLDRPALADAIRSGKTVGDVSIRDGDELYVPDKASSGFNWQNVTGVVGTLTGLYFALRFGRRRGG